MLLGAGTFLALAGIFGVSTRNWVRVYAGTALTAVGALVLAWHYVNRGAAP